MKALLKWNAKALSFLTHEIWKIPIDELPRAKSFFIKQLRIIVLSARGFFADKCHLRASALTFYSLLSVVPVAAMAFGIAKGFGFEKILRRQLMARLPGQEEIVSKVITFSNALLETTRGGILAGLGVVLLLWTVFKVLSHIEESFNDIWGIRDQRSLGRKFSDYLSIMFISPILIIISSSITVFIITQVRTLTTEVALLGLMSPVIFFFLKLLPYCLIWILFTFIYMMMPNTKVRFSSGIIAGIIAGTAFELLQWGYINFQVGTAKYNAIYGSFAALPLFLVWLQISWLIILFGAEISFAHQNVETYEFEPQNLKISTHLERLLSLQISHIVIKNFARGETPLTAPEISRMIELPARLSRLILYQLTESGILSQSRGKDDREFTYQPARDIALLTVRSVLKALDRLGDDDILLGETDEMIKFSETLKEFETSLDSSPANQLIKDI